MLYIDNQFGFLENLKMQMLCKKLNIRVEKLVRVQNNRNKVLR